MSQKSLTQMWDEVPDPRSRRGRRHPLPAVLNLTVLAILAGMKSLEAIAQFGREHGDQGGRLDIDTGLYHFRNREYHPQLGRWLQRDPIGFAAGDVNIVRYIENDPVNRNDWIGLGDAGWISEDLRLRRLRAQFYSSPDGLIVISGNDVIKLLRIRRYMPTWNFLSDVPSEHYALFERGCTGLNMLRLGIDGLKQGRLSLPGLRAFSDLNAALRVQREMVEKASKQQKVVLFALQAPAWQSDLDKYLKPGSKFEYQVPAVGQAQHMTRPNTLQVYDWATAFQTQNGSITLWETMPFSKRTNPELNVHHKRSLIPNVATIYFVVAIDDHKLAPPCPRGER